METDHQQQLLSRLVTYVPFFWVRKVFELPRPPTPQSEWRHGAVLTAELSGMGALAEHANRLGPDGALELGRVLNLTLALLLEQAVFPAGGNLVRLAGDHLVCFFLGEEPLERAAACALKLHDLLERSSPRLEGQSALRLRCAVARGPIFLATIGDPSERMEVVVAGPALDEAHAALDEARNGEVVAGPSLEGCPSIRRGTPRGRLTPLVSVSPLPAPVDLVDLTSQLGVQTLTKINALRPLIPPDLLDRFLADPGAPTPPPRFSRASVLLAEFWSIDPASPEAGEAFNRRFLAAHRIVTRHGGVLSRLDFSGKGRRVVALFGAPEPRGSHEERALNCALELREVLGPQRMRAAVNTGFLFSGEVGSALKREHAVLGEAVQVAAQLLQSADEAAIIAGPETLRGGGGSFELGPSWLVRPRGARQPVSARAVLRRHDRVRASVAPGRLAGRGPEVRQALAAVPLLMRSGGGLVIRGAEGMGKTRFLREVVAQASAGGGLDVRRLRCSYLTRESPFGLVHACAHALTGERRPLAEWIEEAPHLMESQLKALGEFEPFSTRSAYAQLMHRLAMDLITTLTNSPRTLLVIDDLHLGDVDSLAVFRALAQQKSVAFIASSAEPLEGFGQELVLPPLDEAALSELVREQLGEAPPTLVAWLQARSEGITQNARALLAWLVESDALEKTSTGTTLRSVGLESPPATAGRASEPSPYRRRGPDSGPHAIPAGEPDTTLDPAMLARQREGHRQLAEMIEAVPGASGERTEELALLYAESDRPEKAVHYARAASAHSAERNHLGLSLRWIEGAARAAQLVDDPPLSRAVRLEEAEAWHRLYDPHRTWVIAREVLQAAQAAGETALALRASVVAAMSLAESSRPEAEEAARGALALADQGGDVELRARARLALARALRSRGDLAEAEFVLDRAIALAEGNPELLLLTRAQRALLLAERGQADQARTLLEQLAASCTEGVLLRHRPVVLLNLGVVYALMGDVPDAEQAYRDSERLSNDLGLVIPRAAALVNLSNLHRDANDFEEARKLADEARFEGARAGDARVSAAALVSRAMSSAPEEDALALSAEALAQLQAIDDASLFIESAAQLARLAADRGDRKGARELFTAARARADLTGIERHRRALDRLDDFLRTPRGQPVMIDSSEITTVP